MRAHLPALAGPSRRTRTVLALALMGTLATALLVTTPRASVTSLPARPPAPAIEVDTDGLQMSSGNAAIDAATEFAHTHGHDHGTDEHGTDEHADGEHGAHEVVAQALAGANGTSRVTRANATGYTADVAAIRKAGYLVIVPSNVPGALYQSVVTVSRQMASVGVPLRVSRVATGTQAYIRVYVKTDCTGNLLGLTSRVQGGVWNSETRSWVTTAYRASVGICTRTTKMTGSWLTATVQHEFGHAVGLGHYTSTYGGAYQIMKPVLSSGMVNYRTGDVSGLRHLVAGAPRG